MFLRLVAVTAGPSLERVACVRRRMCLPEARRADTRTEAIVRRRVAVMDKERARPATQMSVTRRGRSEAPIIYLRKQSCSKRSCNVRIPPLSSI